jgi:uncharacterized protein (DUF1800 family)
MRDVMPLAEGPWAPYQPTPEDPWDLGKVAHLHRRAAFGATWAELQRDLKDGPAASVDRLLKPRAMTSDEKQILDSLRQGVLDSNDADRLKAWWLYRMLYDPDPLREKLTLFWHGHFATSNRKVGSITHMLGQNELLRRHAMGKFSELLTGIIGDPAMLNWLDGAGSKKEKPNENFGREFLELFTLGIGHYAEQDIREAARAFTGWSVDDKKGKFTEKDHDGGEKTFLKQTGHWKSGDIVRITLEQPACAEFLCRKLNRYFVSDTDDPKRELLRPLAEELRSHDYDIGHIVGVILRSRRFYETSVRRQRVKSPVECSAGLVRILEVPRVEVRLLALALACDRQGLELFYPPTVKGWDGGKTWLNSTTVLERGNWANDLIWGNDDFGLSPYDPLAWAQRYSIPTDEIASGLIDLLVQDGASPKARQLALEAGRGAQADGLRMALQRIIHCPEFQLA